MSSGSRIPANRRSDSATAFDARSGHNIRGRENEVTVEGADGSAAVAAAPLGDAAGRAERVNAA
jgi:hypothetical protein